MKHPIAYYQRLENIWYWLEKKAGKLWDLACPNDKASCWLDWLPAFCLVRRYKYQNLRNALERKIERARLRETGYYIWGDAPKSNRTYELRPKHRSNT